MWESRRDAVTDILLATGVALLGVPVLIGLVSWHPADQRFVIEVPWLLLATHLVASATLLARRRAPLLLCLIQLVFTLTTPIYLLVTTGTVSDTWSGAWATLQAPFVCYAAIVYTSDRRRTYAWVLIAVTTVIAIRPWQPALNSAAGGIVFTVVPALLGLYTSARRRLIQALKDRADRAVREQHRLAGQALAEERRRLASEMHDVVSDRVSLMVLQASALSVAADEATRAAADDLSAAGRQALSELHELLDMLQTTRSEETERTEPPATLPDLTALVAESEAAGVRVALSTSGNPLTTSPAVGRTAYRVIQEALTNVHKHAPDADVRVRVHYGADQVRLTVRNSAAAPDKTLSSSGSGAGLTGLRHRVELVHGDFHAGPDGEGGFAVEVTLPAYVPTAVQA